MTPRKVSVICFFSSPLLIPQIRLTMTGQTLLGSRMLVKQATRASLLLWMTDFFLTRPWRKK